MRGASLFLLLALPLPAAPSKKPQAPADLATIRSDPQPDHRYWSALEFASAQIDMARKAYQEGNLPVFEKDLTSLDEAVQLCDETLRSTGRSPSRNPRHFKRAELKEREIVRRLKTLEDEVGVDERPTVAKVRSHVSELHDEMLYDIMGRRK